MSLQAKILSVTRTLGAAIAAFRFGTFAGGQISTADTKALGVSEYAGAIGNDVSFIVKGIARVEAGAAIAVGAPIKSDTQGRAIPQGGTGPIEGYALTSAAGAGTVIELLLN